VIFDGRILYDQKHVRDLGCVDLPLALNGLLHDSIS
jgi:hypothetical protein